MKKIKFDLINNALDSLRHAVNLIAWPENVPSEKYKQAILSLSHCSELLLKERLRQINPAFVWENVDKYPSLNSRTVTTEKAISRLKNIGKIKFEEKDERTLIACRYMRNAIEHYEFDISEKEAKVMLGKVLSFIFSFARIELKQDLENEFKYDDTWNNLLEELYEFADEHGARISKQLQENKILYDSCSYCGQDTVDVDSEICLLCGHLYEPNVDENDEYNIFGDDV